MRAKAALLQGTLAQNTTPMPKMPPMSPPPAASPMASMAPAGMNSGRGMGMEKMGGRDDGYDEDDGHDQHASGFARHGAGTTQHPCICLTRISGRVAFVITRAGSISSRSLFSPPFSFSICARTGARPRWNSCRDAPLSEESGRPSGWPRPRQKRPDPRLRPVSCY